MASTPGCHNAKSLLFFAGARALCCAVLNFISPDVRKVARLGVRACVRARVAGPGVGSFRHVGFLLTTLLSCLQGGGGAVCICISIPDTQYSQHNCQLKQKRTGMAQSIIFLLLISRLSYARHLDPF